jgi:Fe-S cluster biogenesis protein NfuA
MTREQVEIVLQRVRPYLQADGGDIELTAVNGRTVAVRLTGACANCPSAHMTLFLGIEAALRNEISDFDGLQVN